MGTFLTKLIRLKFASKRSSIATGLFQCETLRIRILLKCFVFNSLAPLCLNVDEQIGFAKNFHIFSSHNWTFDAINKATYLLPIIARNGHLVETVSSCWKQLKCEWLDQIQLSVEMWRPERLCTTWQAICLTQSWQVGHWPSLRRLLI